eukprot:TRINITY_DN745_c0_g1_i3.p1 TRINITY_DN745_c0_g1~~TRINITY_DN745_c0_g1_i3.p1  ORF type:complete len:576 (-),score=241.31 TRINITY_DN745_c0_g1_i3:53-1717(-)
MSAPVLVLNTKTERETGRKAQLSNIAAAKAVAEILRTTLGPRAMLKMILDPMGSIQLTNDGNAILREIDVSHPAAKSMIELSRTQDEEVGDGTTSVIIMAGEMLGVAEPFLVQNMHPTVVVAAYNRALEDALAVCERNAFTIDLEDREQLLAVVRTCIGTKFVSRYGDLMCNLALNAVLAVTVDLGNGKKEIDIKRYARVEKIPGGDIEDSCVLDGVMLNKDIIHPKMRRRIQNPRILLLDCNLEYKKGESQTNIEMTKETDFEAILRQEEQFIQEQCNCIIAARPDLVITEKGVSDLAQHYLVKAGIACLRRVRKTDNNRIARAVGATIVNRPEEIKDGDVGTGCGLFEVKKIGDEYFTFLVQCQNPKAVTIMLRGGSKDVLNEIERNLQDAMAVARNIVFDPRVVPGGGAIEMTISQALTDISKTIVGVQQWPYRAAAQAFEVVPRTLAQNCGAHTVRLLTALRAKHAGGQNAQWGIDGNKGVLADMSELKIYEPLVVKTQTIKTAMESAALLLRIDDIVSGISKKQESSGQGAAAAAPEEQEETFGDNRDG